MPTPRALLLAALVIGSTASNVGAVSYYTGVKGGLNVAELAGDGVDNSDSKNGFAGGAFFGAELSEYFGARIEGLYVQRGAKGTIVTPGDDHTHESTWEIDALEFPLLVTGRAPLAQRFHVRGFAGPVLGFNLDSKIETSHGETVDLGSSLNTVDLGGTFGGGLDYQIASRVILGADVRYTLGATSIQGDIAGVSPDIKNRGLAAMLELRMPLGVQ